MPAIIVLVADPMRMPLDSGLVRASAAALAGEAEWLSAEAAAEIATDLDPAAARQRLAPILTDRPLDLAVLPPGSRKKRLLISDMDSTMITIECIDELADHVGIKAEVAATTRRAMNGEIDFPTALRQRVALLEGIPASTVETICRERVRAMPGAMTLVRTMRANGARAVLVSGGFTQFTSYVTALLGFDAHEANALEVQDGRLTGRLEGELRDAHSKVAALYGHCRELGITVDEALAVGDGANDLPMLQAAGLGVAFHAHPRVRAAAPVAIDHADLTALLYLQGYRRHEFIES